MRGHPEAGDLVRQRLQLPFDRRQPFAGAAQRRRLLVAAGVVIVGVALLVTVRGGAEPPAFETARVDRGDVVEVVANPRLGSFTAYLQIQLTGSPDDAVTLDGLPLTVDRDVAVGHKVAACDIASGDTITKYGQDIGKVVAPIKMGDHVHVHNVKTKRW